MRLPYGFHIEVLRDTYDEYLEESRTLISMVNNGKITIEEYSWEIQMLMSQYRDTIEEHKRG